MAEQLTCGNFQSVTGVPSKSQGGAAPRMVVVDVQSHFVQDIFHQKKQPGRNATGLRAA